MVHQLFLHGLNVVPQQACLYRELS
jgi:hypothetical protein